MCVYMFRKNLDQPVKKYVCMYTYVFQRLLSVKLGSTCEKICMYVCMYVFQKPLSVKTWISL